MNSGGPALTALLTSLSSYKLPTALYSVRARLEAARWAWVPGRMVIHLAGELHIDAVAKPDLPRRQGIFGGVRVCDPADAGRAEVLLIRERLTQSWPARSTLFSSTCPVLASTPTSCVTEPFLISKE